MRHAATWVDLPETAYRTNISGLQVEASESGLRLTSSEKQTIVPFRRFLGFQSFTPQETLNAIQNGWRFVFEIDRFNNFVYYGERTQTNRTIGTVNVGMQHGVMEGGCVKLPI